MTQAAATVRLTMAQALVRYLAAQRIDIDGTRERLCAGGFAIFGHGNVTCLGEALERHRGELPLWRGQNEQSMTMAAIGYARQKLRRRFMFASASAGPGATNMLTAAALAHTNRLPVLMLCGDAFVTRLPDPVLQQVEHGHDPALSVTDAFKAVCRYWDRIVHPAQLMQSLPRAIETMLDPADCGPAFLALPQDAQGWAFDYPLGFFAGKTWRIRRQPPDEREVHDAAALLRGAERPLIIAGGGVQYSRAAETLTAFAERRAIPVVETIAGRANMLHDHPLNCGPIGVTGSTSANALAAEADVIVAVGARLQDFTTGSWSAFAADARLVAVNAARFDACKHRSLPVVGDARLALAALAAATGDYAAPAAWQEKAGREREHWNAYVEANVSPSDPESGNRPIAYAQVIGAVNSVCADGDRIVTAAGGLPAEVAANWRTRSIGSVDVEFGYSCMGYEIAGGWGARMAQMETAPDNETIVLVGDGSYLMLNSDIYSSVLTGSKLIVIVCDNGGFAVIDKLQRGTGNVPRNNLIRDCNLAVDPFTVDFAAHARAMGADAETAKTIAELKRAFARARESDRTFVIVIATDPREGWTEDGHAWWEVGLPEVSDNPRVTAAKAEADLNRKRQRLGI